MIDKGCFRWVGSWWYNLLDSPLEEISYERLDIWDIPGCFIDDDSFVAGET